MAPGSLVCEPAWDPDQRIRFASDSLLEGGGFELPVPDERGYGWPSSVASWAFFSARNCSALGARSGLTPLPAAPGHALSLAAGSRRGKRTRGDAKSARRQWEPGAYTVLAGGGLLCCLSASELDA